MEARELPFATLPIRHWHMTFAFFFGIGFGVMFPVSVLPRILVGVVALLAYFAWRRRQHVI